MRMRPPVHLTRSVLAPSMPLPRRPAPRPAAPVTASKVRVGCEVAPVEKGAASDGRGRARGGPDGLGGRGKEEDCRMEMAGYANCKGGLDCAALAWKSQPKAAWSPEDGVASALRRDRPSPREEICLTSNMEQGKVAVFLCLGERLCRALVWPLWTGCAALLSSSNRCDPS